MTKTNGSAPPPPEAHEDGEEPFDQERANLVQARDYAALYDKFLKESHAGDFISNKAVPPLVKHLMRLAYVKGLEDMREIILDMHMGDISEAFFHEVREEELAALEQITGSKNRSAAQLRRKRKPDL
jgi:hypothetical protein